MMALLGLTALRVSSDCPGDVCDPSVARDFRADDRGVMLPLPLLEPAAPVVLGTSSCCFTRGVGRGGSDRTIPVTLGAAGRTGGAPLLPARRGVRGGRTGRLEV